MRNDVIFTTKIVVISGAIRRGGGGLSGLQLSFLAESLKNSNSNCEHLNMFWTLPVSKWGGLKGLAI